MNTFYNTKTSGQTLVEALIMMGLLALFLPALLTGLVVSRSSKPQQEQRTKATLLLREAQEAIRNVREAGWVTFAQNGTYYASIAGSSWQLVACSGTCPTDSDGFITQIVITDVFRDSSGAIVTTGGTLDPSSKLVTTTVSWQQPYAESLQTINYFTRYMDNLTYTQTTQAEFNTGSLASVKVTNLSGGEVQLADNNKAKWCSPELSSATIDLPDGPPVAVSATASAATTTIPNDVFVATSPYSTNSAKLAYINVTANSDPPVPTLRGIFTLDAAAYSDPGLVPSGLGFDNNFITNDIKYYKSGSGKLYALLATTMPNNEVIAVQVNNGSGDSFQDPVNKIYRYWSTFNTRIYNPNAGLDTGFRNPTANSVDTGGDGDGFASNPTRAYSDNASFAVDTNSGSGTGTNCTGTDKDKHRYYNYGFTIPSGANINGIEVRLDARVDSTTGSPKMCVQLSWDGGTTWTTEQSTTTLNTSEATYLLGGSADTWGRTWSDTNFTNTNFRLRVINVASNTSRDFSLDWAGVKIYYSGGAGSNDQAPFGYGATTMTTLGDTGYVASGGYLYAFDLTNIDSKSTSDEIDQVGCRILLDGFDCQPGSPAVDKKYSAGETGTTWSTNGSPAHNDCSDGGNIELYATRQLSAVQVGANKYVYIAVGAGTNPELDIVDVTSPPSGSALTSSSCGRGSDTGWRVTGTLDFNSQSNTEEASNAVYAKSDGTRAYMSSNGGIDGNGNGVPDSHQFYVINTANKSAPAFLSGTPSTGATSGYYNGDSTNIQLFPRRTLTVLNGQRAVIVGQDGIADSTEPKEYQVLNINTEVSPSYCGGINFLPGFNDLTSVTEADLDNYVYMVANTDEKQLKIIQGGPDGNYLDSGTYESSTFDAGYDTTFNRFDSHHITPAQTSVTYQFAGADPVSGSCNGVTFEFTGPDGSTGTYYTSIGEPLFLSDDGTGYENPARCFRYKTLLNTADFNTTPTYEDISVNYSP